MGRGLEEILLFEMNYVRRKYKGHKMLYHWALNISKIGPILGSHRLSSAISSSLFEALKSLSHAERNPCTSGISLSDEKFAFRESKRLKLSWSEALEPIFEVSLSTSLPFW